MFHSLSFGSAIMTCFDGVAGSGISAKDKIEPDDRDLQWVVNAAHHKL
jgi:hypothetical protein